MPGAPRTGSAASITAVSVCVIGRKGSRELMENLGVRPAYRYLGLARSRKPAFDCGRAATDESDAADRTSSEASSLGLSCCLRMGIAGNF